MEKEFDLQEHKTKALNIADVMQWVDAEIQLPVAYAPVLVCFKEEWVSAIRTAYWCGNSWIVNGNKPILTDKITYWMNLPNPPCA
jgi:hypothetical protein